MGDFLATLRNEWRLIAEAPISSLVWTFLIFSGCWAITRLAKAHQVENLESRLKLRDDEIADYKRKLAGASPEEAAQRIEALEQDVRRLRQAELSDQQLSTISDTIRGSAGSVLIIKDLAYSGGIRLFRQLQQAFAQAGWQVNVGSSDGGDFRPREGLAVALWPEDQRGETERKLLHALSEAALSFEISPHPPIQEDVIVQLILTQPR